MYKNVPHSYILGMTFSLHLYGHTTNGILLLKKLLPTQMKWTVLVLNLFRYSTLKSWPNQNSPIYIHIYIYTL